MSSTLTPPHICFWAKLGSETWPEVYHPVLCHLVDVAQVCHQLRKTVLRQPLKARMAAVLRLETEAAGQWIAFWAGSHDIGKVSPCFQAKSDAARTRLRTEGHDFNQLDDVPHGSLSAHFLPELLSQ